MLVDDIEAMEHPERTSVERVGLPLYSTVRLAFFDCRGDIRVTDGRVEIGPNHLTALVEGRLSDREIRVVVRLLAVQDNQLPGEMIEGRPQIVENLADQQRPSRVDKWYVEHAENVLRAINLRLKDESVAASGESLVYGHLQIGHLGICPSDLLIDPAQVGGHERGPWRRMA